MKIAFLFTAVMIVAVPNLFAAEEAPPSRNKCVGSSTCQVCENCKSCQYCSERSGSCGVKRNEELRDSNKKVDHRDDDRKKRRESPRERRERRQRRRQRDR